MLRAIAGGLSHWDQGLAHLSRQVVRLAQGFGNAISPEAAADDTEGRVEVRQVPGGNIKRFHPVSGAEDKSHRAVPEDERAGLAPLGFEGFVFAAKQLFGAPNGRDAEPQSQVAGETECPGMG